MDFSLRRTHSTGPKGVRLRESWLYMQSSARSRPLDKGGGLQKEFYHWSKNKGGVAGPPGPSPGSATAISSWEIE